MNFEKKFNEFIPTLTKALSIPNSSDWTVKGFIDYHKNIYSISTDTKVVSKIIELMIFPKFLEFAKRNNLELKLSPHQNYYPDITFIDKETYKKYAVDLKSSYKITPDTINGLTLGAFTGYFRNRNSTKNILYPYESYEKHYVFGIIYSRTDMVSIENYLKSKGLSLGVIQRKLLISYINETIDEKWELFQKSCQKKLYLTEVDRKIINNFLIDETKQYSLENFQEITSVVKDFQFFLQEKWKIGTTRPGSGNTKNIGSETNIENLITGNGVFAREFGKEGEKVFDNYFKNYQTKDMAKKDGQDEPNYTNLNSYLEWIKSLQV